MRTMSREKGAHEEANAGPRVLDLDGVLGFVEILLFDAYHLEHGSIANRTETTRVSCDLRFVPVDKARAQAMGLYPSGHIF